MDPLTLSLLGSFLPGLLGGLLGGNPQRKLQRQVSGLLSPANVNRTTNQFYSQNVASPAYAQAQETIAQGANATGSQLASRLGAAGISSSGSGALLSSLMPSLVGSQQAGLRAGAYQSAQGQAQNQIQQMIANLQGVPSGTTPWGASPLRQGLAGGIETFAPFLEMLLKQHFPQFGGGFGNQQGGAPYNQPNFVGPVR